MKITIEPAGTLWEFKRDDEPSSFLTLYQVIEELGGEPKEIVENLQSEIKDLEESEEASYNDGYNQALEDMSDELDTLRK